MERQTRTPEEIKKGLECCDKQACEECPYNKCGDDYRLCVPVLIEDTFELVQQFEAKDVKKAQRITELEQEIAAVKRERDAAVDALGKAPPCENCLHFDCQWDEPPCMSCFYCDPEDNIANHFEWCGVCPDTEVQEDVAE